MSSRDATVRQLRSDYVRIITRAFDTDTSDTKPQTCLSRAASAVTGVLLRVSMHADPKKTCEHPSWCATTVHRNERSKPKFAIRCHMGRAADARVRWVRSWTWRRLLSNTGHVKHRDAIVPVRKLHVASLPWISHEYPS